MKWRQWSALFSQPTLTAVANVAEKKLYQEIVMSGWKIARVFFGVFSVADFL